MKKKASNKIVKLRDQKLAKAFCQQKNMFKGRMMKNRNQVGANTRFRERIATLKMQMGDEGNSFYTAMLWQTKSKNFVRV